jgi:hypothetical protein
MEPGFPAKSHEDLFPKKLRYFVPGEIILHFVHEPGLEPGILVQEFNNFREMQGWNNYLGELEPGSVLTFPNANNEGPVISLAPAPVLGMEGVDENGQYDRTTTAIRTLNSMMIGLDAIPISTQYDIKLRSVAPNWLMSGANHQIGSGGPGSFPSPAKVKNGRYPTFSLGNFPPEGGEMERGSGVHVAILDAAPQPEALFKAYNRWQWRHPLIRSLLRSGGPLHVYPASYADFNLLVDYSIDTHRYLMPDHGLFVAGIIHTLAPEAELYLYEVLNPYGVGCLETIARGLCEALKNPAIKGHPLIINCSLVLSVPRERKEGDDFPFDSDETILLCRSFKELVLLISSWNQVLLIAAAGNDATQNGRPAARYPAAYPPVVGVGALPSDLPPTGPYMKSIYSNRSDDPSVEGYATLGGEEGEGKGVLGVYISKFPHDKGTNSARSKSMRLDEITYTSNRNGWAWWAGTSFATPILSGMVAAWWSAHSTDPADAVRGILAAPPPTGRRPGGDTADNGEKVFKVKQIIP